ncbi:ribosomal RNA small subunit methyltransferase A [Ereboglobus luteus]|uniref:Ribosomal RNA small subunit methyltransferase A n=1 Tax=Ereboglobus luteus TaxID=1796921 RepID=A0A2U8E728_9BACT|nr:rRNA adenine dimethyltransferase family protein [Ereboglobus luteus]AWI10636.1 ribosomal RNA small subunit methyltransferase A [Ereboglobus luteus]
MPLTPSATRELLASLGHNPKRFLGQNFLVDGNIVRKSLELAQIAPADTVVEIGPGLGTLTNALLETGAHVYAVEKDTTLHAHLASTLAPKHPQTFHLICGDALDHPLAGFSGSANPPGEPSLDSAHPEGSPYPNIPHSALRMAGLSLRSKPHFKVVANLPYAISTPWMDAILSGPLPERMVLMLQQEAAQRYTAVPGTKQYSAISIFLQNAYDIAPGHKVSAACFYPRPDIESYLLHLVRKPRPFIFATETKAAIRACFQQRRKQLGALLRDRLPDSARGDWFDYLATAGQFTPKSRPEEIPPELWTHFPANPPPQTRA